MSKPSVTPPGILLFCCSSRIAFMNYCLDRLFWATRFCFFILIFSFLCRALDWAGQLVTLNTSSLLCLNVVKFGRREIGEIVRYLLDKKEKNLPAFQTVATAQIVTKICQDQPPTTFSKFSRFNPNWFTFGGVIIVESENTVKSPRKVNPIFGRSLA